MDCFRLLYYNKCLACEICILMQHPDNLAKESIFFWKKQQKQKSWRMPRAGKPQHGEACLRFVLHWLNLKLFYGTPDGNADTSKCPITPQSGNSQEYSVLRQSRILVGAMAEPFLFQDIFVSERFNTNVKGKIDLVKMVAKICITASHSMPFCWNSWNLVNCSCQ